MPSQKELLRDLPKVDDCLHRLNLPFTAPPELVKQVVQLVIDVQRQKILANDITATALSEQHWQTLFEQAIRQKLRSKFTRVINASGVVIHTNLGRSLLSAGAVTALHQAGGFYSNLEFNLQTGRRGSRYSLVEEILCDVTGAEAALVVNNNAAAVFLALETLAKEREVIVSRGQLVEIGGSFRIPDVMAKSGARLVEVGATNRTHLHDYRRAINEQTALLLRVHTSNFRIIGFTSEVSAGEMATLAREHGLLSMEDLGSGSLIDLSGYGLPQEPTVQQVVQAGIDVITFSGDKLLGGPQAGIIVGRKSVLEVIKKNPLNRALRVDKFTLSSLEQTLRNYYHQDDALTSIPTLRMLTIDPSAIRKKAVRLYRSIRRPVAAACQCAIMETVSRVGGGAMPEHNLPSFAVVLTPLHSSVNTLEKEFRQLSLPVIGKIEHDRFLLDMRTVQDQEISQLAELLVHYFQKRQEP